MRRAPLLLLLCGCAGAPTPEAACEGLDRGIRQGDGAQVYEALLVTTQWSIHSVARSQKKMRAIIAESYPEPDRAAALQRLLPEASSGKDLFALLYPRRHAAEFQRRLGTGPLRITREGAGAARCARQSDEPFLLGRTQSGRWGMAELDREWDQAKIRAIHDLDTVRDNARLYSSAHERRSP